MVRMTLSRAVKIGVTTITRERDELSSTPNITEVTGDSQPTSRMMGMERKGKLQEEGKLQEKTSRIEEILVEETQQASC